MDLGAMEEMWKSREGESQRVREEKLDCEREKERTEAFSERKKKLKS